MVRHICSIWRFSSFGPQLKTSTRSLNKESLIKPELKELKKFTYKNKTAVKVKKKKKKRWKWNVFDCILRISMYTLNNSLSMTWKASTTLDDHIPVAEVDWGIFYLEGFLPINKWANRIFKKKFTFSFLVLFSSTHWRETARMRAPRRWACYVQSNFQLVRNRTGPGILNQLIDGWRCPQKAFGRLDTKHDVQAIRSGMPAVPSSGGGKKQKNTCV